MLSTDMVFSWLPALSFRKPRAKHIPNPIAQFRQRAEMTAPVVVGWNALHSTNPSPRFKVVE